MLFLLILSGQQKWHLFKKLDAMHVYINDYFAQFKTWKKNQAIVEEQSVCSNCILCTRYLGLHTSIYKLENFNRANLPCMEHTKLYTMNTVHSRAVLVTFCDAIVSEVLIVAVQDRMRLIHASSPAVSVECLHQFMGTH